MQVDAVHAAKTMSASVTTEFEPWRALGAIGDAAQGVTDYCVLPSKRDPRWIVPMQPITARRLGMSLYMPGSFAGQVRKWVWSLALKWPVLLGPGRRVRLPGHPSDGPMGALLKSVVPGRDWSMLLAMGTQGASQKATGLVVSPEGRREAIVKLEVGRESRAFIEHEAHMLRMLGGMQLAMDVPKLLGEAQTTAGWTMAQSVLPTSPAGSRMTTAHWSALGSLLTSGTTSVAAQLATRRVEDRLTALRGRLPNEAISQCMRALVSLQRETGPVRSCISHGDFAPWNIGSSRRAAERLAIYDWEYAQVDGLPLLDAFHFMFQSEHLLRHCGAEGAWRVVRDALNSVSAKAYLQAALVPDDLVRKLALVYLVDKLIEAEELNLPFESSVQGMRLNAIALLLSAPLDARI